MLSDEAAKRVESSLGLELRSPSLQNRSACRVIVLAMPSDGTSPLSDEFSECALPLGNAFDMGSGSCIGRRYSSNDGRGLHAEQHHEWATSVFFIRSYFKDQVHLLTS